MKKGENPPKKKPFFGSRVFYLTNPDKRLGDKRKVKNVEKQRGQGNEKLEKCKREMISKGNQRKKVERKIRKPGEEEQREQEQGVLMRLICKNGL